MTPDVPSIGVFYEHQEWFRPLFREMDRRGLHWERLDARSHGYDPSGPPPPWNLVLNRMSPSAHLRGHGRAVSYALAWLEHLERRGVRVVNGTKAFRTEISKARQLMLMEELGLPHPATRIVDAPDAAVEAAADLRFPVVVKANRGGSGAGIRRFETPGGLREAAEGDELDFGPDGTALVQEFVPARGEHITRVEVMGGEFLYAIDVHLSGETFDLCPADICRTASGEELRPGSAEEDTGLRVEPSRPPEQIVGAVEELASAAGIEVGGVEYLVDDRDGTPRFYDVNALSNFVAEPGRVLGFDPFARLVDWLEAEAEAAAAGRPAAGGRPVGGGGDAAGGDGDPGPPREGGSPAGSGEAWRGARAAGRGTIR